MGSWFKGRWRRRRSYLALDDAVVDGRHVHLPALWVWCRQSRQSLPSFGCKTSDQPRHLNLRLTKCFCLLFRNVGRRRRSAQGEEGSVNTISTPCECQQCGLHSDMGGTEPACRGDGNVVIRAMHGVAEADDSCWRCAPGSLCCEAGAKLERGNRQAMLGFWWGRSLFGERRDTPQIFTPWRNHLPQYTCFDRQTAEDTSAVGISWAPWS